MATLQNMGLELEGAEILQPMLKNRYRVEFVGFKDADPNTQIGSSLRQTNLTIQVVTVDLPKLSFEEVTLDRYNSKAYVAGKHTFEAVNIVFEADVGGQVHRAIRGQLEAQQRLIGMQSAYAMGANRAASNFKFGMKIEHLDGGWGTGSEPTERHKLAVWYMDGCWLQNVDFGDLDFAANETSKITATVRYDHARLDIISRSVESAIGGAAPTEAITF